MMSGHIWAQLPRPELPARVAVSERTFESIYQSHRPLLRQLGWAGGGTFLVVLLGSAAAYFWNNRRLPLPPISRTAKRGPLSGIFDAIGQRLVARQPLVQAGFFFTMRRPRSERSQPPFDWDSARGRHRYRNGLSASGVDEFIVGLLERSDCGIGGPVAVCQRLGHRLSSFGSGAGRPARQMGLSSHTAGQSRRLYGGRKTGRGRQTGASRAAGITAVTRSRIRPTIGDPALHIRLAQRPRARGDLPVGVSPTAFCLQLRSDGEVHDSRWRLRIRLLD